MIGRTMGCGTGQDDGDHRCADPFEHLSPQSFGEQAAIGHMYLLVRVDQVTSATNSWTDQEQILPDPSLRLNQRFLRRQGAPTVSAIDEGIDKPDRGGRL